MKKLLRLSMVAGIASLTTWISSGAAGANTCPPGDPPCSINGTSCTQSTICCSGGIFQHCICTGGTYHCS